LITVIWILLLVTKLFLLCANTVSLEKDLRYFYTRIHLCKSFPLVLGLGWKCSPLFSYNLGYFRIGKSWMLCYNSSLVVLAVEDKGCPNRQLALAQRAQGDKDRER
jgi:hypothetical protein